jgi:hypothetical protein
MKLTAKDGKHAPATGVQWYNTPAALKELRAFLKNGEHFTGVNVWTDAATVSDGQGFHLSIPPGAWLTRDIAGELSESTDDSVREFYNLGGTP